MAKFVLDFGMEVDLLTKGELDDSLSGALDVWRQEARGVDYITKTELGIEAASFQIPPPPQGYAYDMKMVSAALSTAGSLQAWWDAQETLPASQPSASATSAMISWGSKAVVLKPGRSLYVTASAGVIVSLLFAAWQIPAERVALIR